MRYLFFFLILYTLMAACCTATIHPIAGGDFRLEDDEQRLWQRSLEEERVLDNSGLLYRDNELEVYLNEVARKLQPPEILSRIPFKVLVIKNPYLNAFTFPNGVVYIHTGILARMDNEAQLATLLAHEMTHCTHRHALRAFQYHKNKAFSLATVQESQIECNGLRDLSVPLGSTGYMAAVTGYSQYLETQADMVGLRLISEAGYDPHEAPRLFEHLMQELEEEKIREPFFFGSHPKLRKRIENYRNFLNTQYNGTNTRIRNADVFLEKTHKVILDNAFLDLKAGRFHAAGRGAEKYLAIKSNDGRVYYLLGEICRQRGKGNDGKRAEAYYEKAISIDSSYPEPHKAIGLIYFKKDQMALARRSFESYLSLEPHAPDKAYIKKYLERCN
jgi:Zn-dependent protease with chaperone function